MTKCRFCGRFWKVPEGVDATRSYCSVCSKERRAAAAVAFADRESFVTDDGRYVLMRPKLNWQPTEWENDHYAVKRVKARRYEVVDHWQGYGPTEFTTHRSFREASEKARYRKRGKEQALRVVVLHAATAGLQLTVKKDRLRNMWLGECRTADALIMRPAHVVAPLPTVLFACKVPTMELAQELLTAVVALWTIEVSDGTPKLG